MLVPKHSICPAILCLSLAISALGQNARDVFPAGSKPTAFLQEGVPIPNQEATPSFTPDGQTLFLADNQKVCISRKTDGRWSKPVPMSFSTTRWKDWDPILSPDGKRLIFVSNRPWPGMDTSKHDNHLWYVDRLTGDSWSEPTHLPAPVNVSGFNDYGPSVSSKGTICFCSRNRDGHKGMGGYCAFRTGDHYEKPQLLALNGNEEIYDPFIAPDERYIIFISDTCLYISYRLAGGGWGAGQKLGPQVNDGGSNSDPYVSPDGHQLYYSSSKVDAIMTIPVRIPR
jgi:Tol biopolymer transport system component